MRRTGGPSGSGRRRASRAASTRTGWGSEGECGTGGLKCPGRGRAAGTRSHSRGRFWAIGRTASDGRRLSTKSADREAVFPFRPKWRRGLLLRFRVHSALSPGRHSAVRKADIFSDTVGESDGSGLIPALGVAYNSVRPVAVSWLNGRQPGDAAGFFARPPYQPP